MPFTSIDEYPQIPITNQVLGSQTGTAVPLSSNAFPCSSAFLIAHPSNSGVVWVVSQNGAMGYPLKPNQAPLVLPALQDLNLLNLYFEVLNDKVCYLATTTAP